MKITKVVIRNFKRFGEIEFKLPGEQIVIAGPNNTGKTTLLQAIATWSLAINRWLELRDFNPRKAYAKAPLSRQSFFSVPVHHFHTLWYGGKGQKYFPDITIDVYLGDSCHSMELIYDSTEQIYIRPGSCHKTLPEAFTEEGSKLLPDIVFVPAIATGLSLTEPLYQPPKIREILGQGRSGEVLRNLLVEVHKQQAHWEELCEKIEALFGCTLLPPDSSGANIIAEYRDGQARLDIASAGSGFLQSLMLFAFLVSRKKSILLLDEPDAHLHILLQDRVFSELKAVARRSDSMLIIATHSERIINTVEPRHLCILLDKPTLIADNQQRRDVITALKAIDNVDIMLAKNARGILYVERHTDISLLHQWATVLEHRLSDFLKQPYWKETSAERQDGGIRSNEHYRALRLACPELPAFELRDGDGKDVKTSPEIRQSGIARLHWQRYEIESYLLIPERIAEYVLRLTGQEEAKNKALVYLRNNMVPAAFEKPLEDSDFFKTTKAKTLIYKTLQEAGVRSVSGEVDLSDIAATMTEDEVHPEIIAKLDAIADHFGIEQ